MFLLLRTDTFAKLFFLVSCIGLFVYAFLAFYTFHNTYSRKNILRKDKDNTLTTSNLENNKLKYILIWSFLNTTTNNYIEGPYYFINNKCLYRNCYLTTNKLLLDIKKYDAIIFKSESLNNVQKKEMPHDRSSHQKYIFYSMESADEYPFCNFNAYKFFNLTCTYKLDSDIVSPYIEVRDLFGNYIAPNLNVTWKSDIILSKEYPLKSKKIAMMWVVRKCSSRNNIISYAKRLQITFRKSDLQFDIFGCGFRKCPEEGCWKILERDYYFYFAPEHSNAEDFVTTEVLNAYNHFTVPVVKGGANYHRLLRVDDKKIIYFTAGLDKAKSIVISGPISAAVWLSDKLNKLIETSCPTREWNLSKSDSDYAQPLKFLPEGSYINVGTSGPDDLAALIDYIIKNPDVYHSFFRYKNYYNIRPANLFKPFCKICEHLNKERGVRVKENFRQWWNKLPLSNQCLPKNHNSVKIHFLQ